MEIIQNFKTFYEEHVELLEPMGGMWDDSIVPYQSGFNDFIENLKENKLEKCKYDLENITTTNLTYGYDLIYQNGSDNPDICYKVIQKLSSEMNIDYNKYVNEKNEVDLDGLFNAFDKELGFKLEFPDVFAYSDTAALETNRGKVSSRMLYALYYVFNIRKSVNDTNISILEIGPGTARTAYYAYKFGFKKYTVIDIISSNLVQYHYNCAVIGEKNVSLGINSDKFLTILASFQYNNIDNHYDIICNFDGLTEYGIKHAQNYFDRFPDLTTKVLSINHTYNEYTFSDLYKDKKNVKVLEKELCDYRMDEAPLIYYKEIIEFTNNN